MLKELMNANNPRPLEGVRILDFTWVRAGPWATRWLGAMGAQIIKVEWPQNPDPLRNLGGGTTPKGVEINLNTSGQFNDTNANKLSITVNIRTEKGLALIKKLVGICDVVIENYSSRVLDDWGLGFDQLRQIRPDIVYVSLAGLGHTGRHHFHTTMGPSAQALSGMTHVSGLPGELPAGWGWSYLDDTGGMYGAMSVLTALYHRSQSGKGQYVDVSQMMMGATLNGASMLDLSINGRGSRREGYPPGNRAHWPGTPLLNNYRGPTYAPHNSYRTFPADYNDWCVIACFSDEQWQNLVGVMGSPDWALDSKYDSVIGRLRNQEELDEHIEEWTIVNGKHEVMQQCQLAGVPAMAVHTPEDRVDNDPQLRHRQMYLEVEHPWLGNYKLQNAPFKLSESPALNHAASPLIGQHNPEVFEGLLGLSHEELIAGYEDGTFWPTSMATFGYQNDFISRNSGSPADLSLPRDSDDQPWVPSSNSVNKTTDGGGPLSGLRVLELSDEKGQWAGKLMADLGADLIKIEPPGGELVRTVGPFLDDIPHPERSLYFWHYNTSKRGITLNLDTADGRGIFRRLAVGADIILETFAPGYLSSLGLGYEELSSDNPGLIMCSLTSFGQSGPWKDYLASDLLHQAVGGQMGCCGYSEDDVPGAPPIAPGGGQAWHMGSHYAYMGIMAALNYRAVTGKGQYIDSAVHDACALTTEGNVPTYIYTGLVATGFRRQAGATHLFPIYPKLHFLTKDGLYMNALIGFGLTPKKIKDLIEWMSSYGLAQDLADMQLDVPGAIQENIIRIGQVIENFFRNITQEEAYHGSQALGFPWGAVRAPDELIDDGHLEDREFWTDVEHPDLGRSYKYPGSSSIWSDSKWRISRRAPLLGEHNEEILCGELGLSLPQLAILAESKAI